MKKRFVLLTIGVLLSTLLLQGCWFPFLPDPIVVPTTDPPVIDEPPPFEDPAPVSPPTPGRFTLRYDPDSSLNPITTLNRENITLSSLVYESLFILDENLRAVPVLCENWDTEDYLTFTIEILPDISMHDGSFLTADDVAYSLRQAGQARRHANKLSSVTGVSSDGELTVTIVLDAPNARFIRLLDVPIIKTGTIDQRIPPGTGPYIMPGPESMRLDRFPQHRHFAALPLTSIHLRACGDSDLTSLFDEGGLSLLWDDPAGAFDIRLNRLHEPRLYNTTALQYIGFNTESRALRDPDVRRAIGCSIERQFIVENIMNVPRAGQTVAAPVAISPVFDMYDPEWAFRSIDPLYEMAALLELAGFEDKDNDSFLEMADGLGGYIKFTLDFIVNIENAHKLAAANRIAETLRWMGFDINVRGLPWGNFLAALQEGNFDMYYGETLLSPDFDLSPLLLPGSLNFGRTGNTSYRPLIQDFLSAKTQEEVSYAGKQLCDDIMRHAPFIPILYKRHAIYSPMGVVIDATPSQSGVFHNFHNWTIDLLMLN
jgi:peptide/nickel transport system substrate-binding protein